MSLRAFGATLAPRAGAVSSLLAKATDCFGKFTLAMTYGKMNKVTENNPVALWFNQDMFHIRLRPYRIALLLALTFTSACAPRAADTPFRPPTQAAPTQILSTHHTHPRNPHIPPHFNRHSHADRRSLLE